MEQPEIHSIEKTRTPDDHIERRLEPVGLSEKSNYEALVEAREAIVGNENLHRGMLNAILAKESRDVTGFARIENMFVAYSENLTDRDIENLVRQFNTGFKNYIIAERKRLKISEAVYQMIIRGEKDISPRGIQSVLAFISNRRDQLSMNPGQKYGFYTEDILDAKHKIDLIECLFEDTPEGMVVSKMNLIQVKSSEPSKETQEAIIDTHRRWILSSVMDHDSLEREFTEGMPSQISVETFTKSVEETGEIVAEIINDPDNFNIEKFMDGLNFNKLSDKQKAWTFSKIGTVLKKKIVQLFEEGRVTGEQAERITKDLDSMENKLSAKSRLPRNLTSINTVNSVIAVGETVIRNKRILDVPPTPGAKKILRVN